MLFSSVKEINKLISKEMSNIYYFSERKFEEMH